MVVLFLVVYIINGDAVLCVCIGCALLTHEFAMLGFISKQC